MTKVERKLIPEGSSMVVEDKALLTRASVQAEAGEPGGKANKPPSKEFQATLARLKNDFGAPPAPAFKGSPAQELGLSPEAPTSPLSREAFKDKRMAEMKLAAANTSARTFILSNDLPVYLEFVPEVPKSKSRKLSKGEKKGKNSSTGSIGGGGSSSTSTEKKKGRWRVHWNTDSFVSRCHPGNRAGLYNSKGSTATRRRSGSNSNRGSRQRSGSGDEDFMGKRGRVRPGDSEAFWVGTVSPAKNLISARESGTSVDTARYGEQFSEEDQEAIRDKLLEIGCIPLFLDPELRRHHEDRFCRSMLSPVLHGVDLVSVSMPPWLAETFDPTGYGFMNTRSFEVYWQAYNSVNQLFADVLMKQCRVSVRDAIWIHDYHLFLLPAMIVQAFKKGCGGKPGMVTFVHSPWPSSELFRPFPHAREITRAVLHSDLVGFHDFGYAQHFIACSKRMLGLTTSANHGGNISLNFKGRVVMVTTNHAGVDVQYLTELTRQHEVKKQVAELKQRHAGKTLIGAVDDLERNSGDPLFCYSPSVIRCSGTWPPFPSSPWHLASLPLTSFSFPSRRHCSQVDRFREAAQ
jgi:hypothetical protein